MLGLKDPNPGLSYKTSHAHPYPSSLSSSASSSASSVFSLDAISSQGSVSSAATNPADVIWENDAEYPRSTRACLRGPPVKPADAAVPPELRRHPRRTNSHVVQSNGTACTRPPPCLLRQSERKVNFVDNLVGKWDPSRPSLEFRKLSPVQILRPRLWKSSGPSPP